MEAIQQINCILDNVPALYAAYMPFVKGGGLFIRTKADYPLGTPLNLTVTIMDEHDPYIIDARVVWITPTGAQGNKLPGIGVQFLGEKSRYLANKIETYLAGMLKSSHITDTI